MTSSVFILSIADMKKDNSSEKLFKLTHLGIKIVAGTLLAVYLILKSRGGMLLPFIVCTVFLIIFISYNRLLVYFHKKGLYTSWQAAEFYKKCRELCYDRKTKQMEGS